MARDSARIYDEYLVASAAAGDRPALGRLVERWQAPLLRHAWRVLGDADRARDAVQDAWVQILRGLARLDDPAAFPAWAFRIVTRRCQRSFGVRLDLPLDEDAAEAVDAPDRPIAGETAAEVTIVLTAMARLPPVQRATLALFYLEELNVAQIATAMDVPPGTVKTRLMHARNKLRAQLEGDQT